MKIYQDILGAKLQELEQQYEHLRNRLQICEGEDPGQIHQELESAKKEYDTLQQGIFIPMQIHLRKTKKKLPPYMRNMPLILLQWQ